ncbi:hypothetical protein Btru_036606 [Bulinus truncatus]|nr:hypothetical protein Btru_036606 [Bulinus truncatus]
MDKVCLIVLSSLFVLTYTQMSPGRSNMIDGIPCTQTDIINMMGKCMIKFSRGHRPDVIVKMRKSLQCETALLNCTAVMETRVCLANLSTHDLSVPCRPHIDAVSDHQFGLFNLACTVRHLRSTCMDLFIQHGLTHF